MKQPLIRRYQRIRSYTEDPQPFFVIKKHVECDKQCILEDGTVLLYDLASDHQDAYPEATCIGRGRYYSYNGNPYPDYMKGELKYFFVKKRVPGDGWETIIDDQKGETDDDY